MKYRSKEKKAFWYWNFTTQLVTTTRSSAMNATATRPVPIEWYVTQSWQLVCSCEASFPPCPWWIRVAAMPQSRTQTRKSLVILRLIVDTSEAYLKFKFAVNSRRSYLQQNEMPLFWHHLILFLFLAFGVQLFLLSFLRCFFRVLLCIMRLCHTDSLIGWWSPDYTRYAQARIKYYGN